jgi:hypothetical protein
MKLHKQLGQKLAQKDAATLFHNYQPKGEEAQSNSQQKRAEMREVDNVQLSKQQPTPIDGQPLPDPADGWVETMPQGDGDVFLAAIKKIKMSDGSEKRFYKALVRPSVLKAKRNKVRKLLKRVKRENEVAALKEAKQRVRLFRALMGKAR